MTDHTDALEVILRLSANEFASGNADPIRRLKSAATIFNISADDERQNIDVAKMILKIMGKSEDLIQFVEDRPGHDWRYALDSSNTRKLDWKPKTSFEEGLKTTVEWYRKRA